MLRTRLVPGTPFLYPPQLNFRSLYMVLSWQTQASVRPAICLRATSTCMLLALSTLELILIFFLFVVGYPYFVFVSDPPVINTGKINRTQYYDIALQPLPALRTSSYVYSPDVWNVLAWSFLISVLTLYVPSFLCCFPLVFFPLPLVLSTTENCFRQDDR